jgi:hypothetical protein
MEICDRTWKRDGQPVMACVTVVFAGPELEEEWHLSAQESDLVRSFISEPAKWERKTSKGKVRDILSLKDKAKPKGKPSGNNSAA